jgi:hypothetical protein
LISFEVTFPRIVLSEFNTHCMLARNSASSRAIPVLKRIEAVLEEPFVPDEFGSNRPGMQAGPPLTGEQHDQAAAIWLAGRDRAVWTALQLVFGLDSLGQSGPPSTAALRQLVEDLGRQPPAGQGLGVHKQLANRLLEPYMWHTVVATATAWSNFFALRTHQAAQPEIRQAASLMLQAMRASTPARTGRSGWHLPFVTAEERRESAQADSYWAGIAAARCARVSYLTHDGLRDLAADERLHNRLRGLGHLSPFEHVGRAMTPEQKARAPLSGKFTGWYQLRKEIPHEDDYSQVIGFQL